MHIACNLPITFFFEKVLQNNNDMEYKLKKNKES